MIWSWNPVFLYNIICTCICTCTCIGTCIIIIIDFISSWRSYTCTLYKHSIHIPFLIPLLLPLPLLWITMKHKYKIISKKDFSWMMSPRTYSESGFRCMHCQVYVCLSVCMYVCITFWNEYHFYWSL